MAWFLNSTDRQKHWSWRAGMFTDEQLDDIVTQCQQLPLEEATVVGHRSQILTDTAIRRSRIKWVPTTDEYAWLYNTLTWNVETINQDAFQFDLTHIEPLQFTEYTDNDQGCYGPHVDHGEAVAVHRKLSFVLQLSDPADYDGGELVLHIGPEPTPLPKDRGRLLFFPSYTLHEVKPVTRGTRHSLVGWVAGPKFR